MTPEITAALDNLVDVVMGDRVDRHLLEPGLRTSVTIEVRDFLRLHPVEFAEQRVRDHEICQFHEAARQKACADV